MRPRNGAAVKSIGRLAALACALALTAQAPPPAGRLGPNVVPFVAVEAPALAIVGVRLVDGTGARPREHQTVVFRGDRIVAIGPDARTPIPADARRVPGAGKTLIPGLVGTHNHLYYSSGPQQFGTFQVREQWISFPLLYLASGVTTMRTTGSVEPYTDLNLKRMIDAGELPGPSLDVTAPYLTSPNPMFLQMAALRDPADARRTVDYWADEGATSFKLYTDITHDVAAAAIDEVHKRGLRVTGHLCSVGFRDAAALGIDALEHGLFIDTEYDADKHEDACPPSAQAQQALLAQPIDGPQIKATIAQLIAHHVAISSTLAVFESFGSGPLHERMLAMMAPEVRADVEASHARMLAGPAKRYDALLRKEMAFERAFVRAGGLLSTGPDPTGFGGVIAGYGDQRGIELLVEAGFTPLEAIRIATRNGAEVIGRLADVGTLEAGKRADAVLIDGDPATRIADIEKVETVFKGGVGFDAAKLAAVAKGVVGRR